METKHMVKHETKIICFFSYVYPNFGFALIKLPAKIIDKYENMTYIMCDTLRWFSLWQGHVPCDIRGIHFNFSKHKNEKQTHTTFSTGHML